MIDFINLSFIRLPDLKMVQFLFRTDRKSFGKRNASCFSPDCNGILFLFFMKKKKIEWKAGLPVGKKTTLNPPKTLKTTVMITIIPDVPENVAAFKATGQVSAEDFENWVFPHVEAKVSVFEELNYLFYLDTDLDQFTAGAWFQDVLLGLQNITKWNRAAIVTDKESVQNFTAIFSVIMPGEFRFFPTEDLENALFWCANGDEVND